MYCVRFFFYVSLNYKMCSLLDVCISTISVCKMTRKSVPLTIYIVCILTLNTQWNNTHSQFLTTYSIFSTLWIRFMVVYIVLNKYVVGTIAIRMRLTYRKPVYTREKLEKLLQKFRIFYVFCKPFFYQCYPFVVCMCLPVGRSLELIKKFKYT